MIKAHDHRDHLSIAVHKNRDHFHPSKHLKAHIVRHLIIIDTIIPAIIVKGLTVGRR